MTSIDGKVGFGVKRHLTISLLYRGGQCRTIVLRCARGGGHLPAKIFLWWIIAYIVQF